MANKHNNGEQQEPKSKNKLLLIWETFEKYFPIALLIIMSVIIFVQVFFRYVMGFSLRWGAEVGRFLVIAITFIGSAHAFKEGTHVSVEAFTNILPQKAAFVVHIFSRLACIVFFVIVMIYGYEYAMNNSARLAPATRVSMAIPYMAVPIGSAMILIRLIILTVTELKRGPTDDSQADDIAESY